MSGCRFFATAPVPRRGDMTTRLLALAVGVLIGAGGPALAAGIPVYDGARAADFAQQFLRMQEQLETARQQLSEARRMYESVSGSRGFGQLMRNPQLREFLPQDMQSVYDATRGGGYAGISGGIAEIEEQERFGGSIDDMQRHIAGRQHRAAATDKAVGLRGYAGAQQRLDQLEGLMDAIDQTDDPKAIAELQARINGEQAAIQNEATKLQMIAQLQGAEQRLVDEQKRAMSRRILNPENQGMPSIRR
jgi:type IV secretion system protein VirB5